MNQKSLFVKTKTGRCVELRSPGPDDADALIDFLKVTASETRFLLSAPEDVKYTHESEVAFLQGFLDDPKKLMVCAFVDGELAGNASFAPIAPQPRLAHRCSVGIALFQKFTGQGIGEALLRHMMKKAAECGFMQMELGVMSRNHIAQALYTKLGFVRYGQVPKAFIYEDGEMDDEVLMVAALS